MDEKEMEMEEALRLYFRSHRYGIPKTMFIPLPEYTPEEGQLINVSAGEIEVCIIGETPYSFADGTHMEMAREDARWRHPCGKDTSRHSDVVAQSTRSTRPTRHEGERDNGQATDRQD